MSYDVDNLPPNFRTSEHKWAVSTGSDGIERYHKDGKFTSEKSIKQAYYYAIVDVAIDVGGNRETVRRDLASRLGEIANNPEPDGLIKVNDTLYTHMQIKEAFIKAEQEGQSPVRY